MSLGQWQITSCNACRLGQIYEPLDCIFTAIDSAMCISLQKSPEHKPVFGDVQGVNIYEPTKITIPMLNLISLLD